MSQLGDIILYIALIISFFTLALSAGAGFGNKEHLYRSARLGVLSVALFMTAATIALIYALVVRDFSISYVARYSGKSVPLLYTLLALWGGQEGSLLFWAWILSIINAVLVLRDRHIDQDLRAHVTFIMSTTLMFFLILLV